MPCYWKKQHYPLRKVVKQPFIYSTCIYWAPYLCSLVYFLHPLLCCGRLPIMPCFKGILLPPAFYRFQLEALAGDPKVRGEWGIFAEHRLALALVLSWRSPLFSSSPPLYPSRFWSQLPPPALDYASWRCPFFAGLRICHYPFWFP